MSNGSSHNPNWPPPAARVVSTALSAATAVLAITGNTTIAAASATAAFVAGAIDIAASKGA
jgi:hypothetical protein